MERLTAAMAIVLLAAVVIVLPASGQTGAYTLNGGTASATNQTYSATSADQSAIYVLNSGHLTLTNCTVVKTGDASNVNNSSQYGVNAGILAASAGAVTIAGGSVTTSASGGNGLFATGSGTSIGMSSGTITTAGQLAHGVDVTYGGSINLTNVNITTSGASSSALATDFGGGTVTVTGGTITASNTTPNSHSAAIYSTGSITVSGATVTSQGDCGGVIDGANSITLTNTALTGAVEGIKAWRTAPGSGTATINMNGGSLTATAGDGFYVAGTTAAITVRGGATISASTGNIVEALSSGIVSFTAISEMMTGSLIADSTSTITAALQNGTTLAGTVNRAALTIDSTSTWNITGSSTLTSLSNSGTVTFDAATFVSTISGSYTQASTGKLKVLLGGTSSYNKLVVTGAANLDGVLNVALVPGFTPAVGATFDVITSGSSSGAFSSTTTADPGLGFAVQYEPTYVRVTITSVDSTARHVPRRQLHKA